MRLDLFVRDYTDSPVDKYVYKGRTACGAVASTKPQNQNIKTLCTRLQAVHKTVLQMNLNRQYGKIK